MDIALELCDRYIFDYVFSTVLPLATPNHFYDGPSNSTVFDPKAASIWQFEPASKIISFEPSDAAYLSQWSRDNIYRQAISLYFITW
jgi:lathosterol oxidase